MECSVLYVVLFWLYVCFYFCEQGVWRFVPVFLEVRILFLYSGRIITNHYSNMYMS
ncbi:hypothetical protein Hanom_Chr17g01572011 [Helianthus anomalus]